MRTLLILCVGLPVRGALYGGISDTFYGGYRIEAFDGTTPSMPTRVVANNASTDAISLTTSTYGGTSGSGQRGQFFGLFAWTKAAFLNGGNSNAVTLDGTSTITLTRAWPTGMNGKLLLRDGNTFYISDTDLGAGSGTSVISLVRTWAVYDPFTNLQFTGGPFTSHTFTDITAVGFYYNSFVDAASSVSFSTSRMGADLVVAPEPAATAFIGLGGIVLGMLRPRSRSGLVHAG